MYWSPASRCPHVLTSLTPQRGPHSVSLAALHALEAHSAVRGNSGQGYMCMDLACNKAFKSCDALGFQTESEDRICCRVAQREGISVRGACSTCPSHPIDEAPMRRHANMPRALHSSIHVVRRGR